MRGVKVSALFVVAVLLLNQGCRPSDRNEKGSLSDVVTIADLFNSYAQVTRDGNITGSGFFVEHRGRLGTNCYFVTAGHVAESLTGQFLKAPRLNLRVKRGRTVKQVTLVFSVRQRHGGVFWFKHESTAVDLAVFPVQIPEQVRMETGLHAVVFDSFGSAVNTNQTRSCPFLPVNASQLLTNIFRDAYRVSSGSEIVALGAIAPLQGNLKDPDEFLVSIRKGVISAMPACDLWFKYGGYTQLFVVECPVLPGDSGGPVFSLVSEIMPDGHQVTVPHLLGVTVSALDARKVPSGDGKSAHVFGENSGLSLVVPADRVAEILDRAESEALDNMANLFQ